MAGATPQDALAHIRRGRSPVPIPFREKGPRLTGWQALRLSEETAPQYFNGTPCNVGIILGEASNGLVDIDLDAEEAVLLAERFLPATTSKFGRASKPRSHWLYFGSEPHGRVTYKDPIDNAMLVEFRCSGAEKGAAAQTVFPPSVHPSGEAIEWEVDGEPARIKTSELLAITGKLAAAALVAKHHRGRCDLLLDQSPSVWAKALMLIDPRLSEKVKEWCGIVSGAPDREGTATPRSKSGLGLDLEGHERYAQAALQRESQRVASAGDGTQSDTLFNAAANMGELIAAGVIGESEVEAELVAAGMQMSVNPSKGPWLRSQIERKGRDGIAKGKLSPRDLSDVGTHRAQDEQRQERHQASDPETDPETDDIAGDQSQESYSAGEGEKTARGGPQPWPPLVSLDAPDLPRLRADCLPGWAGQFAAALAADTETPEELAVGLVLAACSTATARRLRVMVKPGYFEPTNSWWAVALPPGNRKSAVQSRASAPLLDWERDTAHAMADEIQRAVSEVKTAEARAKEFRAKAARAKDDLAARDLASQAADIEAAMPEIPKSPRLWTSDVTPEKLGMLLADHGEQMAWLSSEGGVFDMLAGRYSGGIPNLDLVLKAHSGDSDRVDRGSRPSVFLRHPLLTIGLSPQPEVLRGLATKPGFRGRGLLGRFLFLLPPSPLGYRTLHTAPLPEAVSAAYTAGMRALLDMPAAIGGDGSERPHLLRLSSGAYAEWFEFALHIETTMRAGGDFELITDWAGKCPGAAARLAGVLHGIEHAHGAPWSEEISATTMAHALEIMAAVARHSLVAFDLMGADETIAAARKVWEWIKRGRHDTFTAREAYNALKGSYPRMANIHAALDVLAERGYLDIAQPKRTGSPGRPTSVSVTVRPDLAEGW